jgi:2'-5' RNA ligase
MYLPPLSSGQTRVGLSIPVPHPWAADIKAARVAYGDACAEMIPPHITILEPTSVNISDIPFVTQQLRKTCGRFSAFSITLGGTDTFRPISPVTYLKVTVGAAQCAAMHQAVNHGLIASARRFPFHPHVTLAQEVPDVVLDQAQSDFAQLRANFRTDAIWLYQQDDDGMWRKHSKFGLQPPALQSL